MSFNQLAVEPAIRDRILSFLTPGLPKPLSGWTKQDFVFGQTAEERAGLMDAESADATRRRDIRAPDLATLMRTSIAFNHVASRALYRRVISDDLFTLANHIQDPPAHPHIQSKVQLVQSIRRLHLEYGVKGEEPSYPALLHANPDRWYLFGVPERRLLAVQQTMFEIGGLEGALIHLIGRSLERNVNPFASVSHLSIGAIFGGQTKVWASEVPLTRTNSLRDQIANCQTLMAASFRSSPLSHVCQRGNIGPLSFPPLLDLTHPSSHPAVPKAQFVAHLDTYMTVFPVALGCPTRWQFESMFCSGDSALDLQETNNMVFTRLGEVEERLVNPPSDAVSLEIYASSNLYYPEEPTDPIRGRVCNVVTREGERAFMIEDDFLKCVRREQARVWDVGDRDTWHTSQDTPPCSACGGVYEREECELEDGEEM